MISAQPVPPSMVPARQPKSLLRALKGSIVGPSTTAEGVEGREERAGKQGSHMLESERARSQLATATSGDNTATLRGDVQSTQLLKKECFSATIREEYVKQNAVQWETLANIKFGEPVIRMHWRILNLAIGSTSAYCDSA